jgi:hypothetical protein
VFTITDNDVIAMVDGKGTAEGDAGIGIYGVHRQKIKL